MRIYRFDSDVNRYWHFTYKSDPRDSIADAMFEGRSVIKKWKARPVQIIRGIVSDIMASPDLNAGLAINAKAKQVLEPYLGHVELLRFEYRKTPYWCLYIPQGTNCLDAKRSTYFGGTPDPEWVERAAFKKGKLPRFDIFRVPDCDNYFVTERFKAAVEGAGLTGATFEFMWSSDGREPTPSDTRAINPAHEEIARPPGRLSKVDAVLLRLWEEVIDAAYEECVSGTALEANFRLANDAIILSQAALKRKLTPDELQRFIRSLAYGVTFSTLFTIEDDGLITRAKYCGLHEGLLTASPNPID